MWLNLSFYLLKSNTYIANPIHLVVNIVLADGSRVLWILYHCHIPFQVATVCGMIHEEYKDFNHLCGFTTRSG